MHNFTSMCLKNLNFKRKAQGTKDVMWGGGGTQGQQGWKTDRIHIKIKLAKIYAALLCLIAMQKQAKKNLGTYTLHKCYKA